jgi:omega-6 fatty acid desaturase (delta-12 desaturase)
MVRQMASETPAHQPRPADAIDCFGEIAHREPSEQVQHTAKRLAAHCAQYAGAENRRAVLQLLTTAIPFFLSWAIMVACAGTHYGVTLLLALPTAGLMVRMFIFQHDCGHRSFFTSHHANKAVGRLISTVTLTPFDLWRREHALHHAASGDLDRRWIGDIKLLTVSECLALPWPKRLLYRIYRNPFVIIFLGGPAYFILRHRLPLDSPCPFSQIWPGLLLHNLALVAIYGPIIALVGMTPFLLGTLTFMLPATSVGIWMFFIQHQHEHACWYDGQVWDYRAAALLGSSYYVLHPVLQWLTGNIGLHHVHHLCPKVPNYKLQRCVDASPELSGMNRLTLSESFECGWLAVWDEEERRLKTFKQLKDTLPRAKSRNPGAASDNGESKKSSCIALTVNLDQPVEDTYQD